MTDDSTPRCIICRRTQPEWGVCLGCEHRVDHWLGDLLDLVALAGTTAALTPSRAGIGAIPTGTRTPPIPVDLAVLDLAVGEDLLGQLEGWERDWRHHFDLMPYGRASANRLDAARTRQDGPRTVTAATLIGVVGYLRAWWPQAAQRHPAADEFAEDVRRLHGRATTALRLQPPRTWTVPCPGERDDDSDCGYRLRVEYVGRGVVLHCPRCRTDWTVERLLLVAAAAGRGVWVSAAEAAEQIGVHRATIHRAVADGKIASRYARVDLLTVHEWNTTRRVGA